MARTANYKCPACTGPLHYAGASGKLECDFCGSKYSVEEMEKLYAKKEAESEKQTKEEQAHDKAAFERSQKEDSDWSDEFKMKKINCATCGAKLITDENTVAQECPYCGNPTIIPGQFTEGRKPDYIIPFKYDKNQAIDAMKKFYEKKKFLPSVFKDQNHLEEIKGIYVPFWLFNTETNADIHYTGTRTFTRTSGNYRIIRTDHYRMQRAGTIPFEKIPVDASIKMDNDYMDSIEPFDYSELKPFKTAYLPGFFAEAYDDEEANCFKRAENRSENSVRQIMRNDLNVYETVIQTNEKINVKKTDTSYAFMPVWLLTTKWKDSSFIYAMNGQTGKFVGKLPCDYKKYWLHFLKTFLITSAIVGAVLYFLF